MNKHLFSIVFFACLSIFTDFALCNPAFHLTESQKHWFDAMEQEWTEPFKGLTNLDDREMTIVMNAITNMKKQRFGWLFRPGKTSYYHDENIPKEVMQKTHEILQKHGINPYRIDIKAGKDFPYFFAAVSDQPDVSSRDQNRKIVTLDFQYGQKNNPILLISEQMYYTRDNIFENTLLHECGHLAEAHSGQRKLLGYILKERNVPKEKQEQFFERFTCVIELIADQRLTIGNEGRVVKMLSVYSNKTYTRETITKTLATLSMDCLKVDYDTGYPSYSVRELSLMAMMKSMPQKIQENLA